MATIKFFGLDRLYSNLKDELLEVTDKVYSSGQVLDGPYVEEFENAIAKRTNRKYAVAVNSCTQALEFSCRTNIKENSGNIVLPAISFPASYNAAVVAGKKVKFVDIDAHGMMDLMSLDLNRDQASTIMYVNLYGNVIDYDQLNLITSFFNNGCYIIEDAAQSFGAYYNDIPSGKLGDVSCLSFDPTKNLPNFGSGGMILTDNSFIFDGVRAYRDNGRYSYYTQVGTNSRMSEADCAQMLVKLKYFDQWQQRRTDIANYYSNQLKDLVRVPYVKENVKHAWHKYVIHITDRQSLRDYLLNNDIDTRIHYDRALTQLDSAFDLYSESDCQNAISFTKTCLSLPIYPELTDSEVDHIVHSIKRFYTLN